MGLVKKPVAALLDIVVQEEAYQDAMKYSDAQDARDESDRATKKAIFKNITSGIVLYILHFVMICEIRIISYSRNGY